MGFYTYNPFSKDNPVLNTKQEIGQPLPGYENLYEISTFGRVSNYRKIMKTYKINSGYVCIKLHDTTGRKSFLLHRLVAETFLPNPDNKAEVNHIDGNKSNNRVDNLEWVTSAENKRHAFSTGLTVYNKPSTGKKLGNCSRFHNVSWDRTRNKWVSGIRVDRKNCHQKRFDCEIEAARHVNWIIDELGLTDRIKNIV